MAQIPKLNSISLEDYHDAPEWFQRFLVQLNPFLSDVSLALNGNLTAKNFKRQVEEPFLLDTDASLATTFAAGRVLIKNRLGVKPTEVRLVQCEPQTAGDSATPGPVMWKLLQTGFIQIDMIPGLTTNSKYRLSFVIE